MSNETDELILRLNAKKKQFEADLARINVEANASMKGKKQQLEEKIDEMNTTIHQAKDNFTDKVAEKINGFLS